MPIGEKNKTNLPFASDTSQSFSPDSEHPAEKEFIRVFAEVFELSGKPLMSGSEFDDCAALRLDAFSENISLQSLTLSTDTVRESTDFPPKMTFWQKGWMAAAVNLSDLAAMGSAPVAFLLSVGIPRGLTLGNIEELARGIQECVSFFEADVVGGDTEQSEELTITGTAVGISENRQLMLRKNAREGDLLCVTGTSGSAGIALAVLLKNILPDFSPSAAFLKNLTEPFPRVAEGRMLSQSGAVTAMIDTSDGLATSVYEFSTLSGVFFEIDESRLPFDEEALRIVSSHLKNKNGSNETAFGDMSAVEARSVLLDEALYTGGDYELLFTVSPDKLLLVEEAFRQFNEQAADRFALLSSAGKSGRFPCSFTVIGKAIAEKENVILRQSEDGPVRRPLLKKGYDSFTNYI